SGLGGEAGAAGTAGTGGSAPLSEYAKLVLEAGPEAYFRFEFPGVASTQIVSDVGSALGDVSAGPSLGRVAGALGGEPGYAAYFDQTTVTLDQPFDFAPASPFTFEFWFKPVGSPAPALGAIFSRRTSDPAIGGYQGFFCTTDANGVSFRFEAPDFVLGDTGATVSAQEPTPTDAFTYVAVVSDGATKLKLYVNDLPVEEVDATIVPAGNDTPFLLGSSITHSGFRGAIDEFAVYRKQLSAGVIASHYSVGRNGPAAKAR
ncbi:MAG TPA: LamG domain-containing protein, partial [Polyangiaceae bacterium]|nr:LamG domain-containing protein [Polyangiaceae bacterium]